MNVYFDIQNAIYLAMDDYVNFVIFTSLSYGIQIFI